MKNSMFVVIGILAAQLSWAEGGSSTGAGGGGDHVEPLFISAQKEAKLIINAIKLEKIDDLAMSPPYKSWLKEGRLSKLQYYVNAMHLVFQEGPCMENGNPRGTCYDGNSPDGPKMFISRSYNQFTTPDQAVALVFHEAGHLAGETDHIFLSALGVELVAQKAAKPKVFAGEYEVYARMYGFEDEDTRTKQGACAQAKKSAADEALQKCQLAGESKCKVLSSVPGTSWVKHSVFHCIYKAVASSVE